MAFLGGSTAAIVGALCWGFGQGVMNSVLTAGVAHLVPEHSRARAYGIFSAAFGIAWFLGSALLGALYDISIPLLVIVSVIAELAALIPFVMATRLMKAT
jgi:predicted MFS family arabinose efflux permease